MELIQNKDKRTGLIGTIIFHIILLILFLILGLKTPDPIPEDKGTTIEFGWSETGSGVVETQVQTPVTTPQDQPTPTNTPVPTEVAEEQAVTQEESEVSVPAETKPVETPVEQKEPEPTISQDLSQALDQAWSTPSGGQSQGDSEGTGNQGSPDGGPGKGVLGGGEGNWALAGRSLVSGYSIKDTKEAGIIVMDITVDRQGNVLDAKFSLKQSNTTSNYLVQKAKYAAMRYKFSPNSNAAIEQRGQIRFIFELQ